jgi:hypothetical protein
MWLDGKAWKGLFQNFQTRAFRLEVQQVYAMPGEEDEFAAFMRGEEPPPDYPWRDIVARQTTAGKYMGRVHVVRPPVSDYLRYQFEWGYALTVPVGEDVRILDLSATRNPGLPDEDFWLIDNTVVRMLYNSDGTQIGRKLVEDPNELPHYENYQRLAIEHSVPFEGYWPMSDA